MILRGKKDKDTWNSICNKLKRDGPIDIFYQYEYLSLYSNEKTVEEAFFYENFGEVFFFPYLKTEVLGQPEVLYDFETAYGYGGPVSTTQNPEFLKAAWKVFFDYAVKEKIIAGFIRFHPLLKNEKFADAHYIKTEYMRQTVMMALNIDKDNVWKNYRSDVKNKINKAKKNQISVEQASGQKALKQFKNLYIRSMNEKGASKQYFFEDDFFIRIGKKLMGQYIVYLSYYRSKCVGGALVLVSDNYIHYHLSATEKETRKLGTANLLRHTAIIDHLKKKKAIHFGGGNTNDPNDSLFKFKKGFSKELLNFYIGKVIINKGSYDNVCRKWSDNHPKKNKEYNHIFLKYHF